MTEQATSSISRRRLLQGLGLAGLPSFAQGTKAKNNPT